MTRLKPTDLITKTLVNKVKQVQRSLVQENEVLSSGTWKNFYSSKSLLLQEIKFLEGKEDGLVTALSEVLMYTKENARLFVRQYEVFYE